MGFDDVNLFFTEVLAGHARRHPDKPVLVSAGEWVSWAQFDAAMNRLANALLKAGLQKGERVAVLMGPSIECVVSMFAAVRAGGVLVPCGTMLADDQLATLLADAGARFIFVSAEFRRQADAVRPSLPEMRPDGYVGHGWSGEGWISFEQFVGAAPATPPPTRFAPLDPFSIMYSSGTTGLPKGAVHSQRARSFFAYSNAIEMRFDSDSRTAITTALYTAASWLMLVPTLFVGGTVHLLQGFQADRWAETLARDGITHTFVVPAQIMMLLQTGLASHDLSALKTVLSAGSPLRPDVKKRWLAHFGRCFYELYGFTEGAATLLKPVDHATKFSTVGAPLLGTEFVVVGADDRPLPAGEPGELCGHCPGLMTGYFGRDEATSAAIWRDADGRSFMRSGDIGHMDAQGFVTILDRKKDMIISGGMNIYPTDLEAVFGQHPAVADVSVIGVADEKWGETPLACVIARPGNEVRPEDLLAWANERLAKYQRVRHLRFVDELPRNALGKVLKRQLREIHGATG